MALGSHISMPPVQLIGSGPQLGASLTEMMLIKNLTVLKTDAVHASLRSSVDVVCVRVCVCVCVGGG